MMADNTAASPTAVSSATFGETSNTKVTRSTSMTATSGSHSSFSAATPAAIPAPPRTNYSHSDTPHTISASSSLSGSDSLDTSISNTSSAVGTSRFKHYHKPTVSESPALVSLCQKLIDEHNVEGLAKISRNRGLPPSLRPYAWPLLLSTHPYVQNPSVLDEFPIDSTTKLEKGLRDIPYRRIAGDITRCRKKLARQNGSSVNSVRTPVVTNGSSSPSELQMQDGQAQQQQPQTSQTVALTPDNMISELTTRLEDQRYKIIEDAIIKFLEKWGSRVSYEPGFVYCASALAESVTPVSESASGNSSANPTQSITPTAFATVFEHLMLVILYSPVKESSGPLGPRDSPVNDRIMFFLTVIRKLIPELSSHFDEENIASSIGGDEWLLWWIKWLGANAWQKKDLARVWDMYFGWRPTLDNDQTLSDELSTPELGSPLDIQDIQDSLGQDPFWNTNDLQVAATLDPHTQHAFVCIAILKSNRSTLFDLDQSEIRQFLMRMPLCKDIEFIVSEAGEEWRSWYWIEEEDGDIISQ